MNHMDSRNRDAKEIIADLEALGKDPCRLVIVGSHNLDPSATADALCDQWSSIVELVGFTPRRIITSCAPAGAEKAARLAAKRLTRRSAAVFHRPTLTFARGAAEVFATVAMAKVGDAALVLAIGSKPSHDSLRRAFGEWGKKTHQVEVG